MESKGVCVKVHESQEKNLGKSLKKETQARHAGTCL